MMPCFGFSTNYEDDKIEPVKGASYMIPPFYIDIYLCTFLKLKRKKNYTSPPAPKNESQIMAISINQPGL